jgi:hypothetical protein
LLQTKGELPFDRTVTERSKAFFRVLSASNHVQIFLAVPIADFTRWLIAKALMIVALSRLNLLAFQRTFSAAWAAELGPKHR